MSASASGRPRIPGSVWALGFVSLFTDVGSEMVHSLLPVLLAGSLGASALTIGFIEGAAESLVLITKVFSGYISDAFGKRKPLVLFGYGLAAAVKPLFPLAGSIGTIVTARLLDRFGKGVRGAPRDALIADVTPEAVRGAAFGLRQSMDTVGAVVGPLLAVGLMALLLGDIHAVLWFAVLPGLIAVGLIVLFVREPAAPHRAARLPITRAGLASLGAPFWKVVVVGGLLSLARFSEAFLILRGAQLGLSNTLVPLIFVTMSVVYTLSAWPVGVLSDRWSRRGLFGVGLLVLVVADVALAMAAGPLGAFVGAALWGLHMGLTQGLLSALVADTVPASWRGTGFGVFSLVSGIALLVASVAAGALWDTYGSGTTFLAGGAFALLTLAALLGLGVGRRSPQASIGPAN
ncbi:MAG: MFS transporter [Dokdonella sp.]|nr:MFS transporter [Dokdonella sp.]MCB1570071.1 MFS transporter [Xanthomonadales bacterium]MCB1574356.1 MFS transporter [Xanthomonadales bacterium]MCB1577269.1 MFS transporter [Xanthomonadales bacterium]